MINVLKRIVGLLGFLGVFAGTGYPVFYAEAGNRTTLPIPYNETNLFLANALTPIAFYLFITYAPAIGKCGAWMEPRLKFISILMTIVYIGADIGFNFVMKWQMWGWHFVAALVAIWMVQTLRWLKRQQK